MNPDDTTYTIEFKKKVNISLLNEDPYFSETITWIYFIKEKNSGVFYTSENISTLQKKLADTLDIRIADVLISPRSEGLKNLYYGTI